MDEADLIDQAWTAVGGRTTGRLSVVGDRGSLASALPTESAAVASVAAALHAAAGLAAERSGAVPALELDRRHVADAVRSERFFKIDDADARAGFASLSRFWRTEDGWVRTHANYPWHRTALTDVLGTDPDTDAVGAAIASWRGGDLEDAVVAAGGVVAKVRDEDEWRAHPQGAAVAGQPLVGHRVIGEAPARTHASGGLPATGIRVLDLTRVIAGPVCTRFLGALGADVLRIDPPHRRDLRPGAFADTLLAKRSAELDLTTQAGREVLDRLLAEADVLVCGYRPGSLEPFGLTDDELAARHPGLVIVRLSAWGTDGPWSQRRGFDSIVQAAIGISTTEAEGSEPGALPCQLLDHGTGYLAAAAALDGLRRQMTDGGTHVRELALARTGMWLLGAHREAPTDAPAASSWLTRVGPLTAVAPPGSIDGVALTWPEPPHAYLGDPPEWHPPHG